MFRTLQQRLHPAAAFLVIFTALVASAAAVVPHPLPPMQPHVSVSYPSPTRTVLAVAPRENEAPSVGRIWDRFAERESAVADWHASRGKRFTPRSAGGVKHLYPDDFYEFIPTFVTALPLDGAEAAWTSASANFSRSCFGRGVGRLVTCGDACVEVEITLSSRERDLCEDLYLLGSVQTFHVHEFVVDGKHTIRFDKLSSVEMADLAANGMRVFHFVSEVLQDVYDFAETVELFLQGNLPLGPPSVSPKEAAINLAFLKDKMNITMAPRPINLVNISQIEPTIQAGDFLGIIRLDGLDPALCAYGMGSKTGHTTAAMRFDEDVVINGVTYTAGKLYITESQTQSHYWPVNHIQINPFDKWVEMAHAASYNVVHLPLRDANRARLNKTAVVDYLQRVVGSPYGFPNFLFGWIDTPHDNYPDLLSVEMVGILFALLQKISPPTAELMWNQALNHRLGTSGLDCYQLYAEMDKRGLELGTVLSIPEQDDWTYLMPGWEHPDKPVPASVCDVHVCRILKAGGLFATLADDINCSEFTNWDVYSLDLFNPTPQRPPTCVQADPHNPLCQLMGTNSLTLNLAGTVKPYPHMREHCGGIAPDYYWGNNSC